MTIISDDGTQIDISQRLMRAVLVALTLHRNQPVPQPRMIDMLWAPDEAPSDPQHSVRHLVWGIRRELRDRVETSTTGYRMRIHPQHDHVDLDVFRALHRQARQALAAADTAHAAALLDEALDLWPDPPVTELLPDTTAMKALIAPLAEERRAAQTTWAQARLALGEHADALPALRALVGADPGNEAVWAELMLALYRCGRKTDALGAYTEAHSALAAAGGPGSGPSAHLSGIRERIIADDPALAAPAPRHRVTLNPAAGTGAERVARVVPRQPFTGAEVNNSTRLWAGANVDVVDQPPVFPDASIASPARVYDYLLGGKDNYAVDRAAGDTMLRIEPYASTIARDNRAFLTRAVRHLARRGIRQFLDIGTGLPTQNAVHQVACEIDSGARVVYVDNDPMVTAHTQALLADHPGAVGIVLADLRDPDAVLNHPATTGLLDFTEPVALLLVAIMHFFPGDTDPYRIVARYLSHLPPGSYLVLSHSTGDRNPAIADVARNYRASAPFTPRTHAQIARFFTGLDLIPPGLTWAFEWNPDTVAKDLSDRRHAAYAGVGHKPADGTPGWLRSTPD